MKPLRVGAVGYLNARPLVEGLADDPRLEVTFGEPAEVARRLSAGELDLGLVPVAEAARLGLEIVSDACVASFGAVRSVGLFLRRGPKSTLRAGFDAASRTSRELATWYFRVTVRGGWSAFDVRPEADDGGADAVLAIGDQALRLRMRGLPFTDLSEEWARRTGSPFVFALWAGRPEAIRGAPWLPAALADARNRGASRLAAYAEEAAGPEGTAEELAVYLSKRLRYVLGPAERKGLRRFLTVAGLPQFA